MMHGHSPHHKSRTTHFQTDRIDLCLVSLLLSVGIHHEIWNTILFVVIYLEIANLDRNGNDCVYSNYTVCFTTTFSNNNVSGISLEWCTFERRVDNIRTFCVKERFGNYSQK